MFMKWLDSSEVEAFAASLANDFSQRAPADSLEKDVRGKERRLADAKTHLLTRVERFASSRRLGMFKRAKLGNTLRWKLNDAGYKKPLVESIVLDVVKLLTIVNRKER